MMNEKEKLARFYESHHASGNRYGFVFGDEMRIGFFTKWIGVGKRVLDLGCRDGSLTRFYATGNTVTGCDIDRVALKKAEEIGIETHWLDLNQEFPFDPETFDVVVSGEILEHVYHVDDFLSNVHRVLKPTGIFVGSVPNTFHLKHRFQFLIGKEFESDLSHVRKFNPAILRETLERNGFVMEEAKGIGGRLFPLFPMFLARFLIRVWPSLFSRTILFRAVKR
ncbi:MAG: methyltransferase domain-containing protein [Deltaproteobacteria bacterium]|nr:methyltransferase domain-containing protein [Deltaproteobacteria bacterium]MBW2017081.1 methyltransferase domain-containing protein [Deltaproteobacteria bacterium]